MAEEITVVKLLVRNQDGEFLMLKKSGDYDWMADRWEQPGGKIEEGENRFQAARREVRTETGLEVDGLEDLVRLEIEDDELVNCYVMFTDSFSGEVETSEEHQDHQWIDPEEAREMDWHRNAAYIIPVVEFLDQYRETENRYGEGHEIDVVKLLIQNSNGEFMAMQKTPEDKVSSGEKYTLYGRMAGKWELPGGRFKGAGDRFEAAKREVKEECGLELTDLKDVVREEIEEVNSVNTFILFTDQWIGDVRTSKEHVNYRWVTPREYLCLDWHQDAGYGYPPMEFLEEYMEKEKNY